MSRLRARILRLIRAELARSRFVIQWGGMLGMLAHPLYYCVWTYLLPQPYDNLGLRLSASLLCIPLILQKYWPRRYEDWLLAYWHFCLIYVLPFVCTFLTIKNDFSTMWMMTEVMIIFIMALCIDLPILLMTYIVLGLLTGLTAALLTSPAPLVLSPTTRANLALLPFIILCGMAFSRAIQKGRAVVEKNRALQAIAGSIAHEMRNPLGQIQHSLDRIGHGLPMPYKTTQGHVLSDQKISELYRHLAQGRLAIRRGLQVIAMTLDEVSTQAIDPSGFSYLSARDATRKALEEYGFESEAERQRVHLEVQTDFSFRGSETVYLFVLFNLIKNAVYYFHLYPKATLTITVEQQCVSIKDTGPGIARHVLPNLFEPFHTSGKVDGTGLGLAYCRRAMHAFGGEISCDSTSGQYTTFLLRFPVVPQAELEAHQRAVLRQAERIFRGKSILLVDDDPLSCLVTRTMLKGIACHIDEAANGQLALEQLKRARYDLIVMDLQMPVLDGYATAERIRAGAAPGHQGVPIVALSSEAAHIAGTRAAQSGMNGFVSKSCSRMELIQSLQDALELPRYTNQRHHTALSGKTVLLADDDPYNRTMLRTILHEHEVRVLEASHGQAVLDLLASGEPCDAVIMDIRMPGMDGIEATRAIRQARAPYRTIPVLALSGHTGQAMTQAAGLAGVNRCLGKPVDPVLLCEVLAAQFGAGTPAGMLAPAPAGAGLLNTVRLEELRRLDLLEEFLSDYLAQLAPLQARLRAANATRDFEAVHDALHSLLGISGTIGGAALHRLVRHIYTAVEQGNWPDQRDWLDQIDALAAHTLRALRSEYLVARADEGPT